MHSVWTVKWDPRAIKDLKHLSYDAKKRIYNFFEEKLDLCNNPKELGKPLSGDKIGLWRYRIGDYRAICSIQDKNLVILIIKVSHRKDIYN
ncbi:type II toxin-antitoxin system RelE/ParE family toxin [Holosporaceae bacterium 'Namur']|nr:type II toxin-antitoxin system RelE/ParE family toxin [Holosporaceae bacterium 'Namur']